MAVRALSSTDSAQEPQAALELGEAMGYGLWRQHGYRDEGKVLARHWRAWSFVRM